MKKNTDQLFIKWPFQAEISLWIGMMLLIGMGTVSCSDNSSGSETDDTSLVVETITTGGDPDPSGYTVLVQGAGSQEVEANGSVRFSNLEEGSIQIELANIPGHCSGNGELTKTDQLIAGETTTVIFQIHCETILRNQIVFVSNRNGTFGLFKMSTNGTEVSRIGDFDVSNIWRPAVSPDGTKIAFVATAGSNASQIWIVNADGTNWKNLTQNNSMHHEHPTWSPDGTQIAYHAYETGEEGDIYVINVNGTGKRNITNSSTGDWWPSWSPDGETIAFHTIESNHVYINAINADGSGRRELLRDATALFRNPSWSPDGSRIAFQSNLESEVSWEIMMANSDGSNIRPVTNLAQQGIQHRFPTWSPDGSKIAFDSNRDSGTDVFDIFIINTDGSEVTNITHNTNSVTLFPSWSPIE